MAENQLSDPYKNQLEKHWSVTSHTWNKEDANEVLLSVAKSKEYIYYSLKEMINTST